MSKRVIVPFVIGLAATVAVFAAVRWLETDDPSPDSVTVSHLFPSDYTGPVWVTISETPPRTQLVTLTWGPRTQSFPHAGPDAETYSFTKDWTDEGAPQPLDVHLPAGGQVDFDAGANPPDDAISIAADWETIDPTS
jgi:hypothetical protein